MKLITKSLLKKIDTSVWTLTEGVGHQNGDYISSNDTYRGATKYSWIKAAHSNGRIEVILNVSSKRDKTWGDTGITRYKLDGQSYWSSFDRIGVEPSFSLGGKYDTYKTFDEALVGELKRVEDKLARIKAAGGYVSVPNTGFQVTEARKKELIVALKTNGRISLTPSGFGRGYLFLTKANRRQYGIKYATEAQLKFFDVSQLYVLETEHD